MGKQFLFQELKVASNLRNFRKNQIQPVHLSTIDYCARTSPAANCRIAPGHCNNIRLARPTSCLDKCATRTLDSCPVQTFPNPNQRAVIPLLRNSSQMLVLGSLPLRSSANRLLLSPCYCTLRHRLAGESPDTALQSATKSQACKRATRNTYQEIHVDIISAQVIMGLLKMW